MLRLAHAPLFALLLAPAAAGCDAQAGPDYDGEILASVQGIVTSDLSVPPSDVEVVLVWMNTATSPDVYVGESVPVTGSFPASFTMDLFAPPADEALNDYTRGGTDSDETRIGVALIASLPEGTDLEGDAEPEPGSIGLSEDHVLVYVEADAVAGSFSESLLGAPLEAGFHIMDVIDVDDPSCASDVFDCLRPAPAKLDTQVEIKFADELDPPDWT